jgi:hypothetical protein
VVYYKFNDNIFKNHINLKRTKKRRKLKWSYVALMCQMAMKKATNQDYHVNIRTCWLMKAWTLVNSLFVLSLALMSSDKIKPAGRVFQHDYKITGGCFGHLDKDFKYSILDVMGLSVWIISALHIVCSSVLSWSRVGISYHTLAFYTKCFQKNLSNYCFVYSQPLASSLGIIICFSSIIIFQ